MSKKLRRKELRKMEMDLGVFFDTLPMTHKHPTERFNVYANDDNENHIGEVTARYTFFEHEELRVRTIELVGNKSITE